MLKNNATFFAFVTETKDKVFINLLPNLFRNIFLFFWQSHCLITRA